jgi:hypothetical protein
MARERALDLALAHRRGGIMDGGDVLARAEVFRRFLMGEGSAPDSDAENRDAA